MEEPVELPINGVLDLHTFRPKDVGDLVPEYLAACQQRGILEVRIIHGKGTGQLRASVQALLKRHPDVVSFTLDHPEYGGWGATLVRLRADRYRIVKLASGAHSVHSLDHSETFHPVIGPAAEAEALYLNQLRISERLRTHSGEFVVWDVGLGAAANPLILLRATRNQPSRLRIVSFDCTLEPLNYALRHTTHLPYLIGYEDRLRRLLGEQRIVFTDGDQSVDWALQVTDFPSLLQQPLAAALPKPHVIMFDAFSPATNPAMWTQPLFANLFKLLDPGRPCALPTYSRSTLLRVTLLLAGFFVGVGHPTGEKEETTIAANSLELIETPLDSRWLDRACRSSSAEPLWEAKYRQAPLSVESRQRLQRHRQFGGT